MRAKEIKTISCFLMLLGVLFLASSCSEDSNLATTGNDYCYIKSVVLGNVKRKVDLRDRRGQYISTTNSSFTGSNFAMTINLRDNTIENRDSLPYGSQLSRVIVTINFDGSTLSYREKGSNAEWTSYNATDSLDLTKPLELYLTSNDNKSSRTYTFKVNVHRQEGDSLYWKQCESEVEQLAGLEEMKAFSLNDKLMVLGKKTSDIILAERSSIEAEGTWEEALTTGLPTTTDLQTLRQQDGNFYLSTTDGSIFTSTDAKDWQQVGTTYSAGLTLVEKTANYFYAISEGKLLRSTDAESWEEDQLDTEATMLPTSEIRALSVQQANGNNRIIMVGQKEGSDNAVVWNKMWNESEPEAEAEWVYFPISPDNLIPCPRLQYLNLMSYDSKCLAFGGASEDASHKALDAMYFSQDYGITWRPSYESHLPIDLEGIEGCVTSTVDKNNFIWIITNAQVWRGRLNRLGFVQQ